MTLNARRLVAAGVVIGALGVGGASYAYAQTSSSPSTTAPGSGGSGGGGQGHNSANCPNMGGNSNTQNASTDM
jgi:hypothetical protein